jgi:hypothetical protein
MARVARYVVLEKPGAFSLGIGDESYQCPPGTVVYDSWIPSGGISATRLVHLGYLGPAGSVDASEIPEAPHGAFLITNADNGTNQLSEEAVDLGDRAPVLDVNEADPEKGAVNASLHDALQRIAELEARLAGTAAPGVAGVTVAARPDDENSAPGDAPAVTVISRPADDAETAPDSIEHDLASLTDTRGNPVDVPDGGDPRTAVAQAITRTAPAAVEGDTQSGSGGMGGDADLGAHTPVGAPPVATE